MSAVSLPLSSSLTVHLDKIQLDGVCYESGYLAASELIKAGNHRLGMITGNLQLRIARDRYQGFRQAVIDAGLELDETFVLKGDFSVTTAHRLTTEMLRQGSIPEGIVTSNNRTSLGFLKVMRDRNIERFCGLFFMHGTGSLLFYLQLIEDFESV